LRLKTFQINAADSDQKKGAGWKDRRKEKLQISCEFKLVEKKWPNGTAAPFLLSKKNSGKKAFKQFVRPEKKKIATREEHGSAAIRGREASGVIHLRLTTRNLP